MQRHPVEALLRPPVEWWSAFVAGLGALVALVAPWALMMTPAVAWLAAAVLMTFASWRGLQGWRVVRYQRNLRRLRDYRLRSARVPVSRRKLFLGLGFPWTQRIRQECFQFEPVPAPRGEVELIRLVDQLHHARRIDRVDGPDRRDHTETLLVVLERSCGFAQRLGAMASLILITALAIFIRERGRFEKRIAHDRCPIPGNILRQSDHIDFRQGTSHLGTLVRIIVNEDQRLDAEIQRFRNRPQIVGLALPVGDENRDVIQSEHHFRMQQKGLTGHIRVVLGAHSKNNTAFLQFFDVSLKINERFARNAFAKNDAVQPVVADHTAPERIVEVHHQATAR